MKKTALYLTFILVLLFLAFFAVDLANSAPGYPIPTGPLTPPKIYIESPINMAVDASWFMPLRFSVNGSWDGYVQRCSVAFHLDEEPSDVIFNFPFRINKIAQNFSLTLGPLSEGRHHLQVFASVGGVYRTSPNSTTLETNVFTSESSIYFSVNTTNQAQISILSPLNETYNVNRMIPLEFTVNKTASIASMGFSLDDQSNITIPRNTTVYGPLSDGLHTIKIYSIFSDILPVSSTINFTVDTTAPNVSILSLQNKKYNTSDIPLVFAVNETSSLITYIMDEKVYTITGNTTLTGLQNGNHELRIYATDKAGHAGVSETIAFDVQVPIPPQMAFGIIPPMAIVLIGGLSILIYIEKRRQRKSAKKKN